MAALNPEFAEKFQDALMEVLAGANELRFPEVNVVETFREAGLLTRDKGLVVNMSNGCEVQLTIVVYGP